VVIHDGNDEAACLRPYEYVLGAMATEDAAAFEAHLRDGCAVCEFELRRAREIEGNLALAAAPVVPRPELKQKLMARVAATPSAETQVWRHWRNDTPQDHVVVRGGGAGFEPTKIAGIEVKRLSIDTIAQRVTMMIRMAPGTRYPAHRHGGREECFVLEGDLRHGAQVMWGGDYEVVENATIHGEQWTEGGCLLLIHSSMNDELLA
jgi:anti-sigma factor ChrR (cupin superfamily)